MTHFLLFYEAGPDYLERRPEFRAVHLDHAWQHRSAASWSLPEHWPIRSTGPC